MGKITPHLREFLGIYQTKSSTDFSLDTTSSLGDVSLFEGLVMTFFSTYFLPLTLFYTTSCGPAVSH